MKTILIILLLSILASCSDEKDNNSNNQMVSKNINNIQQKQLTKEISKELAVCLPKNWTVWEEYSEKKKTSLAHIGIGIFDLHFKANYQMTDTFMGENIIGKASDNYYPEIILHFYKNENRIKESVKFTQENPEIISDIHFAVDFGETDEYLIYECFDEKQIFYPKDVIMLKLRECLNEKITSFNKK